MSATNRGSKRIEGDRYYTPEPFARAIVDDLAMRIQYPSRILEPSAGSGVFVEKARRVWKRAEIHAVELGLGELDVKLYGARWHVCDFESFNNCEDISRNHGLFDLIIGNPPYKLAAAHIRHAIGMTKPLGTLSFLLRANFLEDTETRGGLFDEYPPSRVTMLHPRPSFMASHKCQACGARETTGPRNSWACPCGGKVQTSRTDGSSYAVFEWRGPRQMKLASPPTLHWLKVKQ